MIIILSPEDLASKKKNPKVEDITALNNNTIKLSDKDAIIFKAGRETKIIKIAGEKLA